MPRVKKNYKSRRLAKMVKTVGTMVTHYREKAGLSQNQLYKKSGVALSTINEIENFGINDLRLSTVDTLAQHLNVDPIELLHGSSIQIKDNDRTKLKKAVQMLKEVDGRLA